MKRRFMKKKISIIIIICTSYVLPQDILWTKTFGGSQSEYIQDLETTSDSGFILSATTYSYGNGLRDMWLVKMDVNGDTLWTQTYGGPHRDGIDKTVQTSDGGFTSIGYIRDSLEVARSMLIMTDSIGDSLSSKLIPVRGDMLLTEDDEYIISGYQNGKVMLYKADSNGDSLWLKTIGGDSVETAGYDIRQTSDGGYIISGSTRNLNGDIDSYDALLLKTDANGDSLWSKTFGGDLNDNASTVQQTSDGGYVLLVQTDSYGSAQYGDIWLIKTDANGDSLWSTIIEGGNYINEAGDVQQTSDGGYIVAGRFAWNNNGIYSGGGMLSKRDSTGNEIWSQTYEDNGTFNKLIITNDNEFVVGSNVYPTNLIVDIFLAKIIESPSVPIIDVIIDQTTDEDNPIDVTLNATNTHNVSMVFSAYSDTSSVMTTISDSILNISFEDDWNGVSLITVMVTDVNGSVDTTGFTITVNPINDPPEPSSVIYPTVSDTFSTHADNDTLIQFRWEKSNDVDSDVTYNLTIELEFFGNTYTDIHENISDTTIGISSNSLDPLINITSQDEAVFTYYVHASDDEYTVASDTGSFALSRIALGVGEGLSIPEIFALHQNYPNPFNPVTTLRYDLPENSRVNIIIYDMLGRQVKTLMNQTQNAGYRSVIWDATNDYGKPVSAGVYLYQIRAGEFVQTKKMVLLK